MISRREFMQGALRSALAFTALGIIPPTTDPAHVVWARSSLISGALLAAANKETVERWLTWERTALEGEATAQYGRPIRFEVIDEDGQWLRQEQGMDAKYVLWRERLDLHPYWGPKMAALP